MDHEPQFANNPREVTAGFLEKSKPQEIEVNYGAEIVRSSRENTRDALGVCIDIGSDKRLVTKSSSVLSQLFMQKDSSLPQEWKDNTEIMRTVLSMAASVDAGFLEASKIHQRVDDPDVISRLEEIQNFKDALQAQVIQQPGGEQIG